MWSNLSGGTGLNGKDINFPINFIDDNYSVTTSIANGRIDAGSFVYVNETTISGMKRNSIPATRTLFVASIINVKMSEKISLMSM
jgi:hypothetical protein